MALTAIPADQLAAALREGEEASGSELFNLATSKDSKIRESLAARPDAPLSVLILLAQDSKSNVRKALAANPAVGIATSVLSILATDKDTDVVLALIENAATPAATLRVLLDHGKKNVRRAAESRLLVL
ncbi:hypothetical protein [Demequina lutea]|uniref:Leucine rich repeat variant n=1 Tax=Demequina lutea TaxID=431489 RepID=A0A7Y9ZBE6_9MICO|nr:hypothetical protein [Demequina lutea]NYI42292.1 hypothetical protein [Demequina lutea]